MPPGALASGVREGRERGENDGSEVDSKHRDKEARIAPAGDAGAAAIRVARPFRHAIEWRNRGLSPIR